MKPFSTLIHPLHASLSSLRSATLFSQPIRELDAPGYASLVLKPTDLKTLWKQVKEGVVTDSTVFHREVARMFANAIMYNAEDCTPSPLPFRLCPPQFWVTFGELMVAAVAVMTKDMAGDADKLCEGYRRSENFGNGGGRGRKRNL
jgi:hypothetical protein